eukprot:gnl/TRDRNA2_/TRDRNA2_42671_c0_seq1.p1 gnl/TRDRNA2_/TRDRNA2_42671_c0~~gnl/TRDRNA2_/TRDRNA2_42671_c0_seq1.p1  ORF type:complete len:361 (-),score=38.15 gnl/TRDRNA2_/TRDRNA2_42671_c0_seq1:121-1203(-)
MVPWSAALVESVAHALTVAINERAAEGANYCPPDSTPFCKHRRGVEETRQAATVFDSSVIPPIGIDKYLMRLKSTFRCSDASFIAALIVVDRLLEYDGGHLPLTMRNVHRVFFASLVVAVKYNEDLVYSNSHYAKAGGVNLKEVNRLERVLLTALDFHLYIAPEQYQIYEATLAALYEPVKENADKAEPSKVIEGSAPIKPSVVPLAIKPDGMNDTAPNPVQSPKKGSEVDCEDDNGSKDPPSDVGATQAATDDVGGEHPTKNNAPVQSGGRAEHLSAKCATAGNQRGVCNIAAQKAGYGHGHGSRQMWQAKPQQRTILGPEGAATIPASSYGRRQFLGTDSGRAAPPSLQRRLGHAQHR